MQVKGKTEPLALFRPLAARARFGSDVTRTHATAARRPRAREAAPDRHLRALGAAALLPARHDRGRAGRGQEPPLRGALRLHRGSPRARPLAAGPLPSLRGGDRLLGARGDREGGVRHPRVGLARARRPPSSSRPCPPTSPTAPGSWPASPRSSAPAASPPPRRSPSPPGGASSSRWRRRGTDGPRLRGSALGGRRRCSPSSSTWPTGRRACRSSSSARPAPSCYEQHPTWAAGLRNATTINLAPLTDEETARLIGSLLERAVLPADTQRALLERAGGNPLYAEEFVRLLADRDLLSGRSTRSSCPTRCRR